MSVSLPVPAPPAETPTTPAASLFPPGGFPFFSLLTPVAPPPLCYPDAQHCPQATSSHEEFRETFDRLIHAAIGRATKSISPMALSLATFNWLCHLSVSPGKQQTLVENGLKNWLRFDHYALQATIDPNTPPCITPCPKTSVLPKLNGRPRPSASCTRPIY